MHDNALRHIHHVLWFPFGFSAERSVNHDPLRLSI